MVSLTVLRFKQSMFREASSFKDKTTGNEIQVAAGHIAEVEYADNQYSKIAKGKVKKLASKEINCEVDPPANGEWLCEVEPKGKDGDFKVVRILGKADLSTLLAKPAPQPPKKEKQDVGTL